MKTFIVALSLILTSLSASAQQEFNHALIETVQNGVVVSEKRGETKTQIYAKTDSGVTTAYFNFNGSKFSAKVEDVILGEEKTVVLMDRGIMEIYNKEEKATIIELPRSSGILKITLRLI